MQSWMIVSATGVLLAGWLPALCPPFLAGLGALVIAIVARSTGVRGLYLGAILLLGLGYGAAWGETLLAGRLPPALEGISLSARFDVLEPPQRRRFSGDRQRQRFAARLTLDSCPPAYPDCTRSVGRVLLSWYGERPLRAGERFRAAVTLKRPRGLANPDSFNFEAWLSRHRFAATGYVRGTDLRPLADGFAPFHQRWRQSLASRLRDHPVDAPVRGVLLALTTGDRSGLDHALTHRVQRYGLNHLLVISGLHVGLAAGLGFLLGRSAGRRCAHLSAAALALAYSALAGFALPTVRALIMLACVQLAPLLGRRVRPWRSLGLALLLVSLSDPLASHSAGFWLSFAAVALIFTLRELHPGWSAWRLTLVLQVSLSVGLGLIASYWFGGIGWLAPLANLIAVPVLTFWLAPLCLAAALLAGAWPGAAALCWDLAAVPVEAFLAFDERLAGGALPLWLHYRPTPGALVAALAAGLLVLAGRRWPQRWLAALFLLAALFPTRSRPGHDQLEFWLLDVGQGLAAVALHRDYTVVYDTGAGDPAGPNMATGVIAPFLAARGIDRIDVLVISHGDRDHAGGVYSLHRRFEIGETWYGESAFPGLPRQRPCRRGHRWRGGALSVEVVSAHTPGGDGNQHSCVIRLGHGRVRLLLPGDIDAPAERALVRTSRAALGAQVLVVPHHGSRSSSSSPFVAAVGPGLALVSRGYRNRFGHPHPEVIDRLTYFGVPICDTARHGALRLSIDSVAIRQVAGWRQQRRYYWHGVASPACAPAYNGAQEHRR